MVVPSKSCSSTSSASDPASDTPPQTTIFDHGTLRTDSRLSVSLLVDHVVRKSNDNFTLPISTDVAARQATNRTSTPSKYEDDPGGDRVSLALSDEEVGIRLSLLQDFTGGGEDGGDWSDSSGSDGDVGEGRSEPDLKSLHGETFELVGSTADAHPASPTEITAVSVDMGPASQASQPRAVPLTLCHLGYQPKDLNPTTGRALQTFMKILDILDYRCRRRCLVILKDRRQLYRRYLLRYHGSRWIHSYSLRHWSVSSRTSNPPPPNLSTTGGRKESTSIPQVDRSVPAPSHIL